MKSVVCKKCGKPGHYAYKCFLTKQKPIRQKSDKQLEYETWKEEVARPYLIRRDGNFCSCCERAAYEGEKLDIEHTITKGSRPDLKRDLKNLRLYCRWPCHRNKTDHIPCIH